MLSDAATSSAGLFPVQTGPTGATRASLTDSATTPRPTEKTGDDGARTVGDPPIMMVLSFAEAASRVLDHLQTQAPLGLWAITRRDEDEQVFLQVRDQLYGAVNGARAPWTGSLCQTLAEGRATSSGQAATEPAYADTIPVRDWGVRAYVAAPIRTDQEVFGTICGYHHEELQTETVQQLQPLLNLLGQILVAEKLRERAFMREAELRKLATRDHLTGLATRAVFTDRLEHALALHRSTSSNTTPNREPRPRDAQERDRSVAGEGRDSGAQTAGRALSVLLLDLDDFKLVNDTLGHAAGDELLIQLAQEWSQTIQPGNTLARLGGDEFALLVESGLSLPEVITRASRVLAGTWQVAGTSITVGISVGLAHLPAAAAPIDAKEFLARADAAMYAAKRSGKGRLVSYDTLT